MDRVGDLPAGIEIHHADCAEFAWPDLDLCASDPPWGDLDSYRTLGRIAKDHLRPGGLLMAQCGVSSLASVLEILGAAGLVYQHTLAKPLFLKLEQNPGAVHVVDDCEQLFGEKSALTLLRSALGGERINGRRERPVSYSVSGSRCRVMEFYFYGSIIFTSNRPLADEVLEIAAILSRIPSVGYSPNDREIRALMRDAARRERADR